MKDFIFNGKEEQPPIIRYVGNYRLLTILEKKINETDDIEKIKTYCELYKMIYELKGYEQKVCE